MKSCDFADWSTRRLASLAVGWIEVTARPYGPRHDWIDHGSAFGLAVRPRFKIERVSAFGCRTLFFFLLEEENKSINPVVAASGQIRAVGAGCGCCSSRRNRLTAPTFRASREAVWIGLRGVVSGDTCCQTDPRNPAR